MKLFYRLIFSLLFFVGLLNSCTKSLTHERTIYKNDFSGGNLKSIVNGRIDTYNGSDVLGRYEQSGFILQLSNLPSHNLIRVSFDLYIHDSWDGNDPAPDGPDIWIMDIDDSNYIYTTFTNSLGDSTKSQSYPKINLPFETYKPYSNAINKDLDGVCSFKGKKGGTSMYRISKTIYHSQNSFKLGCYGQLEHGNKTDKLCDESWSVDNMEIKTVEYN